MLFLSVMLNFSLMSLSFSFEMSGRCHHAVPECDVELLPDEFQSPSALKCLVAAIMLFLSVMLNFSLMSLSFSFEMSSRCHHAVPECDVELLPDEFVLQL